MEIHAVLHARIDEAAVVLARAFQDDAGTGYLLPDPEHRMAVLPAMFRVMVRHGVSVGTVTAIGAPIQAVAIWLPPGATSPSPDEMGVAGISEVAPQFGEEAMNRLGTLVACLEAVQARVIPEDHWRLFFLGVEPRLQGQGRGSALLQPMVERIRDEGGSCYLDTLEPRNVAFYERHGFQVMDQSTLPGGTLPVWAMVLAPA